MASHPVCDIPMPQDEAAPNSYTGSGQTAFPQSDGVPSPQPSPQLGEGGLKVRGPETCPCHSQARLLSELDPRRVTLPSWRVSAASRAARVGACRATSSSNASVQLVIGSACGQPRRSFCICVRVKNSVHGAAANQTRRGRVCAAGEQSGLMAHKHSPQMRSPLCPS